MYSVNTRGFVMNKQCNRIGNDSAYHNRKNFQTHTIKTVKTRQKDYDFTSFHIEVSIVLSQI